MLILLYILLSLLAVSLWINIGLWREVRRLKNKVMDLCLEKTTNHELAFNNFRRGWNKAVEGHKKEDKDEDDVLVEMAKKAKDEPEMDFFN